MQNRIQRIWRTLCSSWRYVAKTLKAVFWSDVVKLNPLWKLTNTVCLQMWLSKELTLKTQSPGSWDPRSEGQNPSQRALRPSLQGDLGANGFVPQGTILWLRMGLSDSATEWTLLVLRSLIVTSRAQLQRNTTVAEAGDYSSLIISFLLKTEWLTDVLEFLLFVVFVITACLCESVNFTLIIF